MNTHDIDIELPPLPKASKMYDIPGYDEEELKDYARAAIEADRRRRGVNSTHTLGDPECNHCGGTGDVSGEYPGIACSACAGTGKAPQPAEHNIDYEKLYEQMCNRCDSLDAKLAEYERRGEPVAYRLLRKNADGEWVTDGRPWCDGVPDADLVKDSEKSGQYRIEYAFAAPQPAEPVKALAAQAQQPVSGAESLPGFRVDLDEAQEDRLKTWVGHAEASPWRQSVTRLALLLNTTKRGLIDYDAAHHFAQELMTRTGRAALAQQDAEPVNIYVETRECHECGHVGINDAHVSKAACNSCDWTGYASNVDRCPGCDQAGTMTAACPTCGGRYGLLAEQSISAPAPQPAEPCVSSVSDKTACGSENGDCDSQPAEPVKPTAPFDDPRVQKVYDIICGDNHPPEDEHWDGYVSRLIVDALFHDEPMKPDRLIFPTHLRKMWSGSEVQAWIDEQMGVESSPLTVRGSIERYRRWQEKQSDEPVKVPSDTDIDELSREWGLQSAAYPSKSMVRDFARALLARYGQHAQPAPEPPRSD